MRARNLCGFEIHMELFFVNESKKKRKFLDETFIREALCHNVHCLGKESPLLNSTEPKVSIQRLFAAIEDKWEGLDGTLNTKRIIY